MVKNVFQVTTAGLAHGIPPKLLGCSFIVNEAGDTERLANVYLAARYTGKWSPRGPGEIVSKLLGRKPRRPSASYVKNVAGHIDLFRRWCADPWQHEGESISYLEATEDHLEEWAEAMEDGSFAQRGEGLESGSINIYLGSFIGFLRYLEAKKLRATALDLQIDYVGRTDKGKGENSHDGRRARVEKVYRVMRRVDPRSIEWPPEAWVQELVDRMPNDSYRLALLLIIKCGLRLAEVINLPLGAIPSAVRAQPTAAGMAAGFFSVTGKGRKTRRVEIRGDMIEEVESYKSAVRDLLVSANDPGTLLVGEAGAKLSRRRFQKLLKKTAAEINPSFHFTPHLGRHYYAAFYLVDAFRRRMMALAGSRLEQLLPQALLSLDLIMLKENLGHAALGTTERYLVALPRYLHLAQLAEHYNIALDANAEEFAHAG